MGPDFETHRVKTRGGQSRGVVHTHSPGYITLTRWNNDYSRSKSVFNSLEELEKWIKKKRWVLEKVKWFT